MLAQRWWLLLLKRCMGGGLGVEPMGLPFWVIVITIYNMWNGTSTSLEHLFIFFGTYCLATKFGGPAFFIFEIQFPGPHWEFAHCHVVENHWTMLTTFIVTFHIILQCHIATSSYSLPCGYTDGHMVLFHWSTD
jgi:hypothetical protein